jgi:hypothetical protein
MGEPKCLAGMLAVLLVACGGEPSRPYADGSLFLMNQTHDVLELPLYRAAQIDCVAVAREPSAALARTEFRFELCLTLRPAELVALDREDFPEQPLPCEAVALSSTGLEPRGLFWTDTVERDAAVDATLELVAVNGELVLDPAAHAALVPLHSLPDHPCDWAR